MSRLRLPTGRTRWLVGLGAVAVLVVAALVLRRPPGPPGAGEHVVLYGDSLSIEARETFLSEMARTTKASVTVKALPGIAPCDAYQGMRDDMADPATRPSVAVLEFTGNNSTDCVAGPDGPLTSAELAQRYASDVRDEVELFATQGVRVVLVGTTTAPGLPGDADDLINDEYLRLVTEWAGRDIGRVRYAPAGTMVTGSDRSFVTSLPCLSGETADEGCASGEITVRSPDLIHFCPVEPRDDMSCPVYSSGAVRYGSEMARVATQALSPSY